MTLANHVWTDTIKAAIPEFEKANNVKVELTQLGEDQLSDQYNVKLNAGTDEIDVMMYRPLQEGKTFAKNGYLADLTDKVKADSSWNWSDFQAGPVSSTTYDGKVVGVPTITEREVLYYRKDLLEKAGLPVPTTMEELQADAQKIKDANPGIAGFVARTGKSTAVTQFSSFLYSFGGDFMDNSGKSTVNSDAAKKAYAFYGGLIKDQGPANVSTDMSWPEAMAIFTQGKAAFYTEADSLYKNATDPAKSKVADTVGFAPLPAGPAGSKPYNVPSWALGVNAASKNQDMSWKFIQWATSKDMTLKIQQAGVPGPRNSVWADPAGVSTYPKDLASAIAVSAKNGVGHDRPVVNGVAQAREIVGAPIVTAITGGDSSGAADSAQTAFEKFLAGDK
ncbi:MAG TPA: sugar ABC transporter substrate-binding protein [Micrococcaceae bacterium]|nr:sugar ABC transporter substrate-binding protein [Micrococcaceae bacterium]